MWTVDMKTDCEPCLHRPRCRVVALVEAQVAAINEILPYTDTASVGELTMVCHTYERPTRGRRLRPSL